jgi:GAF domain-containing protein
VVTERRDGDLAGLDVEARTIDPVAYVSSLEELAGLLLEDRTLFDLLEHVLVLTARAVEASVAVSVTVVGDDGGHTTAAASSDDARTVDDAQYAFGEGPCVEALHTGEEQRFDDLTELERWPRFRHEALSLGFRSVLAVPLRAGQHVVGCLNVFAAAGDALGEEDREVARRIAAPVASALANARAHRRVQRLTVQLQETLEGRAVVERAKGALMAHTGCSEAEATERLHAATDAGERSVTEVAGALLDDLLAEIGRADGRPVRAATAGGTGDRTGAETTGGPVGTD